MAERLRCPRCGSRASWLLRDGRRRCARCRRDWRPGRLPLRLSPSEWRALLRWFVRGATSAEIARETRLERKRVLRALMIVRRAMVMHPALSEARPVSAGDAPVAERQRAHPRTAAASRPSRFVALGLQVAEDRVWGEVLPDAEAELFGRWLRERPRRHSISRNGLRRFTAIVYRGRLYRLTDSIAGRVPFGRVEAFWAYLQRQLRARGGIRRERLGLYVAEFAWRYNQRKLPPAEQVRALIRLIRR